MVGALRNLAVPDLPTLCFKFPACPRLSSLPPQSEPPPAAWHVFPPCYILSTLPPTPTQSLSQTISCSFPSDQFLRKDNYRWREEAENSQSQEHQEKLNLVHSPPARRAFILNTGQLWLHLPTKPLQLLSLQKRIHPLQKIENIYL